jgi:hypothetical protein
MNPVREYLHRIYRVIQLIVITTMSSRDWKTDLYNGVVTSNGKTPRIASGNITKSNQEYQLPDHVVPTMQVMSDNKRYRGLKSKSKQKFSVHRAMSFLPQE